MAQDTQVAQAAVGFVLAFTSTAWVRCVPWASWASLDVVVLHLVYLGPFAWAPWAEKS